MTAVTPGQAAYEAWFSAAHAFAPATGTTGAEVWARGTGDWHGTWEAAAKAGHDAIAAQDARPAPGLREAIQAKITLWRDYAQYRPTDTRDEITERAAVEECAGELDALLGEYPETEPKPAHELAAAMVHVVTDLDSHRRHGCPTCVADAAPGLAAAKPDLGTAWRLLDEARERLGVLHEQLARFATELEASGEATAPSRKSVIEYAAAARIRHIAAT